MDDPCHSKSKSRKPVPEHKRQEIIRRSMNNEKVTHIARSLDLPRSTVNSIVLNSVKANQNEAGNSPLSGWKKKFEGRLLDWIRVQKPPNFASIQDRALSLYESLKNDMGDEELRSDRATPFEPTDKWFKKFCKAHNLDCYVFLGEPTPISSPQPSYPSLAEESDNCEHVEQFGNELFNHIKTEGYESRQVFNVDKTGLYFKKMMAGVNMDNKERMSKERISIFMGGNANGDKKLKPLVVYRNENPPALGNVVKSRLPVIWKSDPSAAMTCVIFREWFVDYFIPEMEQYCEQNKMSFKILLVMNSGKYNANIDLESLSSNISVLVMPPEIPSPMQNVIEIFKANYLRRIFKKLSHTTDLGKFWKRLDILKAIFVIERSWDEISCQDMNWPWNKIYPDALRYFENSTKYLCMVQQEIREMANCIGYNDVKEDDVAQLLRSHDTPLNLSNNDQALPSEETRAPPRGLTDEVVREGFSQIYEVLDSFLENDSFPDRAITVTRNVKDALAGYRQILRMKKAKRIKRRLEDKPKPSVKTIKVEGDRYRNSNSLYSSARGNVSPAIFSFSHDPFSHQ